MTHILTKEAVESLWDRWHGDGTFAYPLKRSANGRGYRVYAFGFWWLVSKVPSEAHDIGLFMQGGADER